MNETWMLRPLPEVEPSVQALPDDADLSSGLEFWCLAPSAELSAARASDDLKAAGTPDSTP
ncbi:hypothetical protein ABZU76_06475 [Amycolatopsis sp. NPDC005232]|uniref:hypothetical protein n=1 Tax=Amycolatopsis sp. NPDC005232 TaxID=3157027 RepID=UPI0033A1FED4